MRISKTIRVKISRYLLILLIPLVVISVFVYKKVLHSYKEDIIQANGEQLSYIHNQIEGEIQAVIRIAIGCNDEEIFSNELIKHMPYMGKGIIDYFKKYQHTIKSAHTIAYYPYGSEYVYTDKSSMQVKAFCEDIYNYGDLSRQETEEKILNAGYAMFRPSENMRGGILEGNYITFVLPLLNKKGNFIVLFPESFILDYFDTKNNEIIITNDRGEIILSTLGENPLMVDRISRAKDMVSIGERSYYVTSKPFRMVGWNFYVLSSMNYILNPVKQTSLFYVITVSIMVLIIGIFIAYITVKEHNSLERLLSSADKYIGNEDGEGSDEYDKIRSAIGYLEKTISNLRFEYDKNRPFFIGQKILRLITGEYTDINLLLDELGALNISLGHNVHVVVSIRGKAGCPMDLVEVLFGRCFPDCGLYRANSNDNKLLIFLAGYNNRTLFQQDMEYFAEKCNDANIEIAMGISGEHWKGEDLYNALEESSVSLSYKVLRGYNIPIYYREDFECLDLKNIDTILLNNILNNLEASLLKGSVDGANGFIDKYFKVIERSNPSPIEVAMPCHTIIYFFFNYVNSKTFGERDISNQLIDVVFNFDNIKDLKKALKGVSGEIISRSMADKEGDTLIVDIKNSIEQSFRDSNFSIGALSRQLGMSVSSLSHYYKRKTGATFSYDLAARRVAHATYLLRNTDLSIKNIGMDSGYYSIVTFLRNFKTQTGNTPSSYRKRM